MMYLLGILCLVVATATLPVLPDPPTLSNSVVAAHQNSKIQTYIQNAVASAPLQDDKDNEKVKKNTSKIASVVFSPRRQLPPFYDSILLKAKNSKKHMETIIPEKSLQVELLPDPGTVTNTKTGLKHCEVCANILIVSSGSAPIVDKENVILDQEKSALVEVPPNPVTYLDSVKTPEVRDLIFVSTNSAPVGDKKDDEEVEHNMVKTASVVMPPPPELQPFDYSLLEKQIADQKQKYNNALKQGAKKSKEAKDVVILDQVTLPDSVTALPISEIISASKNANEESNMNMVKIASIDIPPPPELPPFDYSILRKQKADFNLKSEYSAKQSAEKYKEEKETVILHLEKPVKLEVPPNPATLPDSVLAIPVSEVTRDSDNEEAAMNMVKVAPIVIPSPPELPQFDYSVLEKQIADQKQKYNNALKQGAKKSKEEKEVIILDQATLPASVTALPVSEIISASNNANEESNMNMVKIASIDIPPPPELPPFDYSILRKQKADFNLKSEYSAKQSAQKYKEEKETVIVHLEKPVKVEVPPNPATLPDSVLAIPVSEVTRDSDNEEATMNMVKVAPIVIPPPPELPQFDYSVLEKQIADQKQKYNNALKQGAKKSKEEKEVIILDQATLPASVTALPVSEIISASNNADEESNMNMVKIASIDIPPPPELPPFDYSILRKQKADFNLKSEYSAKQSAQKYKEEKETVIVHLEKPVKVEVPPNPATLPDSVLAIPVSEVTRDSDNEEAAMNMVKVAPIVIPPPPELPQFDYSVLEKQIADQKQKYNNALKQGAKKSKEEKEVIILDQATLPASVTALPVSEIISASKNANEESNMNMVKIASIDIPPPPELPPFDYSILRKQKADFNLKSEYSAKQSAQKYKEEKETGILHLEKPVKLEVPPNPATLPDSVLAIPVSEVTRDSDNEEAAMNMVKVAPIVIPSPPELPQFDYSVLEKQIADQKQKYNNALKQGAKKSKEEKEVIILDQATLPASVTALPVSEIISASNNANEESNMNMVKIASIDIPPPPELPPFDYSILRKQKADFNLKSEYSAKQSAQKYKEDKKTVIVHLEKPVKVAVPPNPATLPDSVLAIPVSEVIRDSDNEEAAMNMVKVAPIVIPPPPELPQFDYSILKKQFAAQKQKFNNVVKEAEKPKKEKGIFIIRKPAEVKDKEPTVIEESKFVRVSRPTEEFKTVEEIKPTEVLLKESVKQSEDIPVIIQLTIPSTPFLSKLISNCPPQPSFDLNWSFQRPSMSRCPHLIYPKLDIDGKIYTN